MAQLQNQMWTKIMALDPPDESGLRLTNCLTSSDEPVDWQLGDYLILWARQQGIAEEQIIAAFHVDENGQ